MSLSISFTDVLRIPEFQNESQLSLLSPDMDKKVLPYLYQLGGDTNRTLSVQACKHRPWGKVVPIIGYHYSLHERTDRAWLNSPRSSIQALIDSQTDFDLMGDLINMSQQGVNWDAMLKQSIAVERKKKGGKLVIEEIENEETYEADLEEMSILRDIQISIRGTLSSDEDMIFTGN